MRPIILRKRRARAIKQMFTLPNTHTHVPPSFTTNKQVHRNLDPNLHQFEKAHEYTRAVNAAKLDRIFAKPFIAAFEHGDGVMCLAKNPKRLNSLLAGSADGEIKIWDIAARRCLRRLLGHTK